MKSEKVTQHPSSAAGDGKRSKLGEILVENGAITVSQLEHALSEQGTLKLPLGQILLKLDYVTDETMRQALGHQLNVPYIDLENVMIDRSLARVINPTFAKRHSLLPVATVGRTLTVAMDDPTATAVVQDLQRLTGFSVTVVTSSSRAIQRAFKRLYDDVPDAAEPARAEADRPATRSQIIGAPLDAGVAGEELDALFHQLLVAAIEAGGRAIHLDPSPAGLDVRIRAGGRLEGAAPGLLQGRLNQHARELAARLRTLIRFDAARGPQHGSTRVSLDRDGRGVTVDLRVSIVPGPHGDSIVVRLFDRSDAPRALDAIGLAPAVVSRLSGRLAGPAGVFLVSGGTPDRVAEVLHACLRVIARPAVHVVTVEDPIAYVNEAVTQSEVGARPGGSFAGHLRAVLQHDPDVIMVGDLTDRETAAIAFRAAGSGRLVLGGFAGGAAAVDLVPSLVDLGVPPSAISQSLAGVLHLGRDGAAAGGAAGVAPAQLWLPDEQDAGLILERAPLADLRHSARRTTVA